MAVVKLQEGLRWGHLRVVEIGVDERTCDLGGGISETYTQAPYAVCKCTCGGEVRLWASEWTGIRGAAQDCGCGVSGEDGARTITTITMPLRVRRRVVDWQRRAGVRSFSRAVLD